ncbi:hypothetical protein LPJ56_004889, partial [Coemansia sp. RSA 2599]
MTGRWACVSDLDDALAEVRMLSCDGGLDTGVLLVGVGALDRSISPNGQEREEEVFV